MLAMRYLAFLSVLVACAPLSPVTPAPRHAPEAPAARADEPPPHPVILAYRETLRTFLHDEEIAELDAVSTDGTIGGDSQRLRYIAADRTIRDLLPLALEAQGDEVLSEHAARLRALPPLLNRDVDFVVQPVVARAMRALRLHRAGRSAERPPRADGEVNGLGMRDRPADALEALAREEVSEAGAADYADAMAEYAETYARAFGTSTLTADAATAAAADAIDAGFIVRRAIEEYGADRERVLESARGTLAAMADAARRRERMPLPERDRDPTPDPTDP